VIANGDATSLTWVKAAGNFVVPFVVSNLGLLAGKRAERDVSTAVSPHGSTQRPQP
jgi:hypothetical protein